MNLKTRFFYFVSLLTLLVTEGAVAQEGSVSMKLGIQASVSADGKQMAFIWGGDIWTGSTKGGRARQLTQHPAQEWTPKFSPSGREIAFVSERDGSRQIYVIPISGGVPQKLTDHSEGYYLLGWDPDGASLVARGLRDHVGRRASRLLRVSREKFGKEELLFDAYGERAEISPDGEQVLFTREGVDLYRREYRGSQASQIWSYEFATGEFRQEITDEGGARSPLWKPDGEGFYYVAQREGAFNLVERDVESGEEQLLTSFEGDGVLRPALSLDGRVIVFRRGTDFYRIRKDADGSWGNGKKLSFRCRADVGRTGEVRQLLSSASEVSFSDDGLEIAFVAGGDVWVMDTVLREPKRVTDSVAQEKEVMFSKDGESIFYLSDSGVTCKLWRAKRSDRREFWWQNDEFVFELVLDGKEIISNIGLSPDGKRLAYVEGLGDLWISDLDGSNARRVLQSWNIPEYDWSPDGHWLAYSLWDNDFNRDVWITPVDGSMLPYNLSRHPDWEGNPRWSPDGKLLAFTGRRHDEEIDIYYVWLQRENDQLGGRDRSEAEAIKAMKKERKGKGSAKPKIDPDEPFKGLVRGLKKLAEADGSGEAAGDRKNSGIEIDLVGLASRVRRILIPDAQEGGLFWSPDSKQLAFSAKVKGVEGLYSVEFPDKLEPSLLLSKKVDDARWLKKDRQIVYREKGVPGNLVKDKWKLFPFKAAHSYVRRDKFRVAFLQAWRAMRDHYYDPAHGGRDWEAVRSKYEEAAADAVDLVAFENVVAMMLGELNGSHLGFRAHESLQPAFDAGGWRRETAHIGVSFEEKAGRLVVVSMISDGPADREGGRLQIGDVLVSADGLETSTKTGLLPVLNGFAGQRIDIVVERDGKKLTPIRIPTISYRAARRLQQRAWVEANRREVEAASEGRLGYLYVAAMMWGEFENFEREIYAVGAGKDGIVIDVRDNGGGFTADHLLTVLMPVEHAVTVPRGGGRGYPGDRRVYGTWGKPIVVLCNQNSFSNAEIFSHAVKALGRGKLVGVPTAGGVISTGSTTIMDVGSLRMPFRGWFKVDDGEDMELNGAIPDIVVWPRPGDRSAGVDRQLEKAIEVLGQDVDAYLQKPQPDLRRASER